LRHGLVLAAGTSSALVLQVLAGVLTAHFLLPRELGLFSGIGLAIGYVSLLQLGVINGLNRELPVLWGATKKEEARRLAYAAQAYCLGLGGVVFVLFTAVGGWQLGRGNTQAGLGWLAHAIIGVAFVLGEHFYPVLYKTTGRFASLARITTVRSMLNLVLVILVAFFGFVGLCLKGILVAVANLLLLLRNDPVRVRPVWWTSGIARLIRAGLPIFMVGQLWSLWVLGNNTLILKLSGPHGFGLYSIVLVLGNLVTALPLAIGQVVYPKMAREWGRGATQAELVAIARIPTVLCFLAMVPVVIAGWILLPPVLSRILPRYVGALPAARWELLMGLTMSFTLVNGIFNVLGKQRLYAVAIFIGILSYGGYLTVFLAHSGTAFILERSVQAMLVGQLAFVLTSGLMVWRLLSGDSTLESGL